ncbi:MAG: C25 family cysteine peptidase [Fidelibacterota bacterium]
MRLIKPIIFGYLGFSLMLAADLKFRDSERSQVQGPVPLAFKSYLTVGQTEASNLTFVRGEYLIITPDALESYLIDFIQFKKSQGFDVVVATLSQTGTNPDDIKAFILSELEQNPLLEYVLLIGDVDGIGAMPSFYYGDANDVTDQKYSHLVGNDYLPDVFVGRFSIDSILELLVIIQKTIKYHRDPLAGNPNWLENALVVAGNYSNTVPIPVTPVWTSHWVREILLDYGYTTVDTVFYPPLQYGAPQIQSAVNNGVGIVNYRGWGDANGWHYPEFHVSDVSALNNGWMTPVFTSFVCNANDFANNVDPCLGEALIRSGSPSSPKGGVAVIGPSDLHTSTKYNNIINTYMYDALLDHNTTELAPAMLAGQLGLFREFPDQNGAGEAQEFYLHVYNILGDPSLDIHLRTPDTFTMTVDDASLTDGFLSCTVQDGAGNPVADAVIAVLENDELIAKGITDRNGQVAMNLAIPATSSLDIYANKNGFIQGHITRSISAGSMVIGGYANADGQLNFPVQTGVETALFPVLINNGSTTIPAGTGTVAASHEGIIVTDNSFDYPAIPPGENRSAATPVQIYVRNGETTYQALLSLAAGAVTEKTLSLKIDPFNVLVTLGTSAAPDPNSTVQPTLHLSNKSGLNYTGLTVKLETLSDFTTINLPAALTSVAVNSWDTTLVTLNDYTLTLGDLSWGSTITLLVTLMQDTVTVYSQKHHILIEPSDTNLPTSPSGYGYWAYDDTDVGYPEQPVFDWIELDPAYGGEGGTEYLVDDDDHINISLPFSFTYFGDTYTEATLSSNGWISFVPCEIDYFWNYTIPMALGPKAQVAAFWDDLEVVGTDLIRIYTRFDASENRFIIEWSRALNNFDEITMETFEIILYDPAVYPTVSGDGIIEIQYLDILDVDSQKNYATVGIEDAYQNDGIQYAFNNTYAAGAAPIANSRVIRFTTNPPDNYQAPLTIKSPTLPTAFRVDPVYPNPFNATVTIPFVSLIAGEFQFKIFDLLGREIYTKSVSQLQPGNSLIRWHGTTTAGQPVSSGTYFLVVYSSRERITQKLVLLK